LGATPDAEVEPEVVPEGAVPDALSGPGTVDPLRVSNGGVGVGGGSGIAPEGLTDDVSLFSGSDRKDLILSKIPMMALPLFENTFTAIVL